jgi:hypothetical protein
MAKVGQILMKEAVIILVLWLGGWMLFSAGAFGLKNYKERYWQENMVNKPAFRKLSALEKEAARHQFMGLWETKPGDEPFRTTEAGIKVAYAAQASGFWIKTNWLLCYVLIGFLRLLLIVRSSGQKKPPKTKTTAGEILAGEVRTAFFIVLAAALWYIVWAFLAPSLYEAYQRFFEKSYAYLWNSRAYDFDWLSRQWPFIVCVYPLGLVLRLLAGLKRAVRG